MSTKREINCHGDEAQARCRWDDLKKLENELKKIKLKFAEQANSFRAQSYKTPPGPLFNGLCISAARYEGLSDGVAMARNRVKKLRNAKMWRMWKRGRGV